VLILVLKGENKMFKVISPNGKWVLEWENIGEAIEGGEYTGEGDTPALRATLINNQTKEEIPDGSYCTLAIAEVTTEDQLREHSMMLFSMLGDTFSRRTMQLWTWQTK
jgi:hypothetical protein